ncbi:MAG: hypothetical protein LBU34_05895 [Planctomycetaceae bacterium]|jgi:hypothetical protein|nr:hypothetical protein [Planctomycetaceae bacterium]
MHKIFETYHENFGGIVYEFVKIYVTWKNEIFSLIDLLKIWETPLAKIWGDGAPGGYHWKTPATLYRELMVNPIRFRLRMSQKIKPNQKYSLIIWFHG